MGAISVVTSGKGGVGKSTTTAYVGLAMAAARRRVLLIDCDAGLGCLDLLLGISEGRVFDLADVVSGGTSPAGAIYESPLMPGLFLLPAPQHEEDLISPQLMRQVVPQLAHHYDYVLLDSPAGIGPGFRSAAAPAQQALLVTTTDPVSVAAAAKMCDALHSLGFAGPRLVINCFSPDFFRQAAAFPDLDAVIDAVGAQLIAVVPEDPSLRAAAGRTLPPAACPAAKAFARLARRLEGKDVPLPALQSM